MKIRTKLFAAFGVYVLLAAVLGFAAYRELRTISKNLALVEIADDMINMILEVRRYEKNFLLFREQENFLEVRQYLNRLTELADNIGAEIVRELGEERYVEMRDSITAYEREIGSLVVNFVTQRELEAMVRGSAQSLEAMLSGADLQSFLLLRRHEKNVMIFKNAPNFGRFERTIRETSLARLAAVQEYRDRVSRLYRLFEEEKRSVEQLRETARSIEAIIQRLVKAERADIAATIDTATRLLAIALIAVVIVGLVVNARIAKAIVVPIQILERATQKVAEGDFSQNIPVKGKDELAALELSFNQMEDRLRDTTAALEESVRILEEKQDQLVEAKKLASVGMFAAGIAHEINNPLTSVLTFSHLMLEQCPKDDPHCDKLRMIARETERARVIVRQLLNFARETTIRTERISVNRPVSEIIESLVAQEAFEGITLDMRLDENLPDVLIDPAQIGQVVLNIALNAIHAITPPGRVGITTRRAGPFVEISFTDTGGGIPEEHLNKLFDPFFTTKGPSKGSGLGLAVSYGIVKKHGGDIMVSSVVGQGSTFTVRLPINGQN